MYTLDALRNFDVPDMFKTALASQVLCDCYMTMFGGSGIEALSIKKTLAGSICDEGCNESLID